MQLFPLRARNPFCSSVRIVLTTRFFSFLLITFLLGLFFLTYKEVRAQSQTSAKSNGASQQPRKSTAEVAAFQAELAARLQPILGRAAKIWRTSESTVSAPILLIEEVSSRAIALNSVTWVSEPFSVVEPIAFSSDTRTRVMMFAQNLNLLAGETVSSVTADAQDSLNRSYGLTVEYVGVLPFPEPISVVILRLSDQMTNSTGDVMVRLFHNGLVSNQAAIRIGVMGSPVPEPLPFPPTEVPTPTPAVTPTPSPSPVGCPGFVIEGFGKDTVGGCGGTVYTVTNLNDSGPGSLREFVVNRTGPRIIRFSVAGTITLNTPIAIFNPFVTIDGSTAPNQGIAIKGGGIGVDTNNVILRYIRIRPGTEVENTENNDALLLGNFASNVVIDHCSFSWATDGLTDLNANGKVTVQWSIMSEQLAGSGAVLIFYANPQVSFHHNLLANNGGARNPELGRGSVDWVNNVIYRNQDGKNFYPDGSHKYFGNLSGIDPGCSLDPSDVNNYCNGPNGYPEGGPVQLNYVGNFFKPGGLEVVGNTLQKHVKLYGARRFAAQSTAYFFGNIGPARPIDSLPQIDIAEQEDVFHSYLFPITTSRHAFPQITTTSAPQAYIDVLAGAGARLPCLDAVDRRILLEVATGTGSLKTAVPAGGWPDLNQPCQ